MPIQIFSLPGQAALRFEVKPTAALSQQSYWLRFS